MTAVKTPDADKPVGAGGISKLPPGSSSPGGSMSLAKLPLFLTFIMPESDNSRKVTALSNGSPRCPSLTSKASFMESRAIFSSLSVFGGMFLRAGNFVLLGITLP